MPTRPTGTTGAPLRIASRATPVRNLCSRPSGERVPSGKIPSARPSSSTSTPVSMTAAADRMSVRATGTWPIPRKNAAMARPRSPGVVKYSALAK